MTLEEHVREVRMLTAKINQQVQLAIAEINSMKLMSKDIVTLHTNPNVFVVRASHARRTGSLNAATYDLNMQRNEIVTLLQRSDYLVAMKKLEETLQTGIMPTSRTRAHPDFLKALRKAMYGGAVR